LLSSATPSDSLAVLLLEERAVRVRKQNIAAFGYAWIKPAGCPKTMLGMREEEAEREEGLAAAGAEMNAAAAAAAAATMGGMGMDAFGDPATQAQIMPGGVAGEGDGVDADELERDLDDDIPDADTDGLVEEGEEGFEEDEDADEELMERNLDDDIPDAFPEDDDEEDDFDNQPDLDDAIPAADDGGEDSFMVRDLDEDVPDATRRHEEEEDDDETEAEGEWQHTDSEADDDDDDNGHDPFAEHFQTAPSTTTPGSVRGLPPQPSLPLPLPQSMTRETEAQRRFLQRWSGGGGGGTDVFNTSGMMLEDDDLRASIASQESVRRNSRFGRRFPRRGGPRDSLD
jgi:hypothetical protein